MNERVFGRTNRSFASTWLAPELPQFRESGTSIESYIEAVLGFEAPVDISASPALFGRFLMSGSSAVLLQNSSVDIEHSTDARHAADLLQAHLVETLSCIGRPYVDFYFVRSRRALEEAQLAGIMEGLESARQEGHIRYLGLRVENYAASIGNWQFHDAFDAVSAPDSLPADELDTLRRMAASRRSGFLVRRSKPTATVTEGSPVRSSEVTLLSIRTVDDLQALRAA